MLLQYYLNTGTTETGKETKFTEESGLNLMLKSPALGTDEFNNALKNSILNNNKELIKQNITRNTSSNTLESKQRHFSDLSSLTSSNDLNVEQELKSHTELYQYQVGEEVVTATGVSLKPTSTEQVDLSDSINALVRGNELPAIDRSVLTESNAEPNIASIQTAVAEQVKQPGKEQSEPELLTKQALEAIVKNETTQVSSEHSKSEVPAVNLAALDKQVNTNHLTEGDTKPADSKQSSEQPVGKQTIEQPLDNSRVNHASVEQMIKTSDVVTDKAGLLSDSQLTSPSNTAAQSNTVNNVPGPVTAVDGTIAPVPLNAASASSITEIPVAKTEQVDIKAVVESPVFKVSKGTTNADLPILNASRAAEQAHLVEKPPETNQITTKSELAVSDNLIKSDLPIIANQLIRERLKQTINSKSMPRISTLAAISETVSRAEGTSNTTTSQLYTVPTTETPSITQQSHSNPLFAKEAALSVGVPRTVWNQRFAEHISMLTMKGAQHARIRLDPPELGPMTVRINQQGAETQIQFTVNNPIARELVDSGMQKLREMLEQQGFSDVDVDVSEYSQDQAQDDAQAGLDEQEIAHLTSDSKSQERPLESYQESIGIIDIFA